MQILTFQKSGDIATDNPPSDQIPKIQGEFICSKLQKKYKGVPLLFFENYIKSEKIYKGVLLLLFWKYIKCFENIRGYLYYSFEDSFIFWKIQGETLTKFESSFRKK